MSNEQIELNIDVDTYKQTLESMTTSELSDYLKSLSGTIKEQTIKQTRALFLIGQKSVNQKWFTDNMTNTPLDEDLLKYDTYDTFNTRTGIFNKSITNVSYDVDSNVIEFTNVLKANGYLYEGDISKITDVQELITIINKSNVQINSIMDGADALKPLISAHKQDQRDIKELALKARLIACKNSTIELAKLRLKLVIVKHIADHRQTNDTDATKARMLKYREMYAKAKTKVSKSDKVECVTTISDDATHTKIVNGIEQHKHEGIKGYHPITRKHNNM